MYIYNKPSGRLGNAIYRYIASIIFGHIYKNFIISEQPVEPSLIINDEYYLKWLTDVKNNNIPQIDTSINYIFIGFFQYDYSNYKDIIYNHILNNPHDKLWTDGNNNYENNYNYVSMFYESQKLLFTHSIKKYEIVIHLRLEDSIIGNRTMNPNSIIQIIDTLPYTINTSYSETNKNNYCNSDYTENHNDIKKICIVVNTPKSDIEIKYIDFFKNKYDITLESNDPITDYHIMKNAKILITSLSTLSWCAALMSDTIEQLYIPNIKNYQYQIGELSKISNTIIYDYNILEKDELYKIL